MNGGYSKNNNALVLLRLLFAFCWMISVVESFASTNVVGSTTTTSTTTTTVVGTKKNNNDNDDDGIVVDHTNQLQIAFVTGNAMKIKEVEMILSEEGAVNMTNPDSSLVNLRTINVDLPEIQEVNTEGIAKEKALLGAQLAGGSCLVEDTSLKFHSLGGMPGPYIKWFQERLKSEGLYKILTAYEDKTATAVCTLAFCPAPHADPVLFTGKVVGTIIEPQPGGGFGWDSIFVPDGLEKPFSKLSTEEKNQLSHRGAAVRQWATWLAKNKDALIERQNGGKSIGHKGLDFKPSNPEQ